MLKLKFFSISACLQVFLLPKIYPLVFPRNEIYLKIFKNLLIIKILPCFVLRNLMPTYSRYSQSLSLQWWPQARSPRLPLCTRGTLCYCRRRPLWLSDSSETVSMNRTTLTATEYSGERLNTTRKNFCIFQKTKIVQIRGGLL